MDSNVTSRQKSLLTSFSLNVLYVCKSFVNHIKYLVAGRVFVEHALSQSKIIRSLVQLVTKKILTLSMTKAAAVSVWVSGILFSPKGWLRLDRRAGTS